MTDYAKGDTVTFKRAVVGSLASDSWRGGHSFGKGDTATVTTVRKNAITVKVERENRSNWESKYVSYNVPRDSLARPNNEAWDPAAVAAAKAAKPKVRKLGEVPEGTLPDGTPYISPTHPGLQWLWDDAGKAAAGYCNQYDRIADMLGIPGRLRDFRATKKVDGLDVSTTVKARSQKEADALLEKKLAALRA